MTPGGVACVRGAVHHQVVQRTEAGHADMRLSGTAPTATSELRMRRGDGSAAASAPLEGTDWAVTLRVPVGGPYDLVLVDAQGTDHTLTVDMLVGDIWVLAGQSNMNGMGRLCQVEPPSPFVHILDMARTWRLAEDPLHQVSVSPDSIHRGTDEQLRENIAYDSARVLGAGLGVAFGVEVVRRTGVPLGLVATAHGGTSLALWNPALAGDGEASLVGSLVLSVEAAGGRVAGVLWYQGESDALEGMDARFADDLHDVLRGLRDLLGDERLPLHHVQIGRLVWPDAPSPERSWTSIREQQRLYAGADGMASAIDLDLEDAIHLATGALRRLGRRLARLATGAATTPQPRAVSLDGDGRHVVVAFDGVNGTLRPRGRLPGFSVRTVSGDVVAILEHAEIAEDGQGVQLRLTRPPRPGEDLWYGYGLDPHCTLVDDQDMAVPAFGPWPLAEEGRKSPDRLARSQNRRGDRRLSA